MPPRVSPRAQARPRTFTGVLIAVALALVAVAPFGWNASAAPTEGDSVTSDQGLPLDLIETVNPRDPDGEQGATPGLLAIDSELGLLAVGASTVTVGIEPEDTTFHQNYVGLIDTQTLEQVASLDVSDLTKIQISDARAALDGSNHRLFLGGVPYSLATETPNPGAPIDVVTVDLTGETDPSVRQLTFGDVDSQAQGTHLIAWTYDTSTQQLYALTGPRNLPQKATYNHPTLHAIDASALVAGDADPVVWSLPVGETCPAVPTRRGQFIGSADGSIYFPCAGEGQIGGSSSTQTLPPIMHGIMRVRPAAGAVPSDTSNFETDFFPFGGDLGKGFALGNDGIDKIFVTVLPAGNQKLFVFDPIRGAWTGAVKLSGSNFPGTAADPVSGRLYQLYSDSGRVQITESDRAEVPNGQLLHTDVTSFYLNTTPLVDPGTRRLFTRGDFKVCEEGLPPCERQRELEGQIGVFQDHLPPAPPLAPFDPDDRTEDVEEVSGETSFAASGNAAAFGARYTFVGGTGSSRAAKPSGFVEQFTEPLVRGAQAGPGTRHLFFGQAIDANLAASSFGSPQVGASAAGFVPGEQTVNDLRRNSNVRCAASTLASRPNSTIGTINNAADADSGSQGPFPIVPDPGCFEESGNEQFDRNTDGLSWPDEFPGELRGHVSLCRVFSGEQQQESKPGSAVSCDPAGPKVESASVFDANEASPFAVGHAEAVASVARDGERGVVAMAEALARGINVLGVVRIGEIRTTAEAFAHGRPGTASTKLRREAHQVAVGPPGEEPAFTCGFGQEPCDLYQVADAINSRFQPRIRAFVPSPATAYDEDSSFKSQDPDISNGTDGGAKATVQIDPYLFQSNKVINSIRQFEVPALTIIAYDDHKEPSRHILQLGAVALDANYTVSSRPSFDFPSPDFDGGDGGSTPGSDGVDGRLDVDLPLEPKQRAIQVPPFEPLTNTASQTDPDQAVEDLPTGGGQTDVATTGDATGEPSVPSEPSGPVSSGAAPTLSTVSAPDVSGDGAPAPEVAAPAGEADGEQHPQPAASDQQQGPGGLTLTQQQIGETVPMAALWLLIALPLYLAVRRHGLMNSTRR